MNFFVHGFMYTYYGLRVRYHEINLDCDVEYFAYPLKLIFCTVFAGETSSGFRNDNNLPSNYSNDCWFDSKHSLLPCHQ